MNRTRISAIAALQKKDRGIGNNGGLLFHIPEDMKRFKAITMGHPVIMGRKTWESIPEKFRPLPGRTNIVITRNTAYDAPGAHIAHSLKEALSLGKKIEEAKPSSSSSVARSDKVGCREIFVIGGGSIYAEALPHTRRLYLTLVDTQEKADAFFPEYTHDFTHVIEEKEHNTQDHLLTFCILER